MDAEEKSKHDVIWKYLKTLTNIEKSVPTWAGCNSLIGTSYAIRTVSMLPVVNGIPANWENLYTAIKPPDELRKIYHEGKTISFDLK